MNNNSTDHKIEALKDSKTLKEIFLFFLSKNNALFNFLVLSTSNFITLIIIFKEILSRETQYYEFKTDFVINKIPYYLITFVVSNIVSLSIIHTNKILQVITDNFPAIIELGLSVTANIFNIKVDKKEMQE